MFDLKIRALFSDKAQKEFYYKSGALEPHTEEFKKAFDTAVETAQLKGKTAPFAAFAEGYITKRKMSGETEKNGRYDRHISRPLLALIEANPNPRDVIEDIKGQITPATQKTMLDFTLRLACEEASAEIITCLINAGADINADGGHPLHKAIIFDNEEAIKTLNDHGVDWDKVPPFYDRYDQKSGRPAYIEKRNAAKERFPAPEPVVAPPPEPIDSSLPEALLVRRPIQLNTRPRKAPFA